jgi:hypothetical protein
MLPLLGIVAAGNTFTYIAEAINGYNEGKILNEDFRDWLKVNAKTQKQMDLANQKLGLSGQFDWRRTVGNEDYQEMRAELDKQLSELNLPDIDVTDDDLFSPDMKEFVNRAYGTHYRNTIGPLIGGASLNSLIQTTRREQIRQRNTDFSQTQAAQYNEQHNIAFEDQTRWDPDRKKFVSVGKWMKEKAAKEAKRAKHE